MELQFPLSFLPGLCLFFLTTVSFLIFKAIHNKHMGSKSDIKPYPILGHLPQFIKNRHRILDWVAETLSLTPINTFHLRGRPGNADGILTANVANVEHLLRSSFDLFPKGSTFQSTLQDFLGDGIFNADGHLWKSQRKIASFEFNTRSLRAFVAAIVKDETEHRLIPLLKRHAANDETLDLQDVLEKYAFDNICKVAFGEDPACLSLEGSANELSSRFALAFRDAAELSAGRFQYAIPALWKIKRFFGIGSEKRLKEAIKTVHDFAVKIIRSRKKEMKISSSRTQADNLLSRFMAYEDYSEEFLRDIVVSFLLAGRDTTSAALVWFFWLVSSRPDVRAKILEEITSVRSRSETLIGLDELREMQYLHAALTESMRLYPPVPANAAMCLEDHVLPDGTEIKKGWFVSIHSYAMGRMEAIWGKDCREYKPERWIDENGKFRPESPFKFLAFHAGPRMCLGKEMAYIQMKSIVACVMQMFEIEVVEKDKRPEQRVSLTLRMRGGLPVRVRLRSKAGC